MSDLISRDKLIIDYGFTWDDITPTHEEMVELIRRQPTVDAVEVVRCKDCKHLDDDDCPCDNKYFVTADCFCFWGERK